MSPLPDSSRDDADATALPNLKVQRTLVFVVVILGLLIVAGLVAVIGRVLYLSSRPGAPGEASGARTSGSGDIQRAIADVPLPLPPGAQVKSMSLSGNRLAVHYEGPEGASIVIVDLGSKSIIARVKIGRDYLER